MLTIVLSLILFISTQEYLISKSKMAENKTILVTGGAGYIGTHCIIELLEQNFNVVAIDNFTNAVKGDGNGKYSIF